MKKCSYPDWVEKFRSKGHTIRKVKQGYGLYSCTSVYVKGSYPKSIQTYLGMITENDGFIPKGSSIATHQFIEYGFTYIIWLNFKRELMRATYGSDELTTRLGLIFYVFHSVDSKIINATYLSNQMENELVKRSIHTDKQRLITIQKKADALFSQSVKCEEDRMILKSLLLLCVIDKSYTNLIKPIFSTQIIELLERNGLKYE